MMESGLAMAKRPSTRTAPKSRRWLYVVLALFVLLVGTYGWFREPLHGYADVGTAYGARVACSCRYVAGRDLDSCKEDFLPGMDLVTLSEDDEEKSVTARFPLLASATAGYREGYGCVKEKWDD